MRTVQLEGQVVLKIAKHCRESDAAAMVTGQLLGLDVGPTLEVTDCFPYPVRRRRRPSVRFLFRYHCLAWLTGWRAVAYPGHHSMLQAA